MWRLLLKIMPLVTGHTELYYMIKFGIEEQIPEWVDKVISIDWFVEFSASEFGNPDFIADIHCTDGHRVIFFEATPFSVIVSSSFCVRMSNSSSNGDIATMIVICRLQSTSSWLFRQLQSTICYS